MTRIRVTVPGGDRDAVERRVFERLDALRAAEAVPASDARRDAIERRVFERLDGLRSAERAEAVAPLRPSPRRWPIVAGAMAAVVAAAVVVVVAARRGDAPVETGGLAAQRVVTPPGGRSQFTVGDAVVDAGSDTSVEVSSTPGDGVTLVLARGSVECDVEPRGERPPFRVVAGDTTVVVVGTRFTVVRSGGAVRVDVVRGKVRVDGPGGVAYVAAGDTWSSGTLTAAADGSARTPDIPDRTPDTPARTPDGSGRTPDVATRTLEPRRPDIVKTTTPKQAYEAAQKLERTDRAAAARSYRQIANGADPYAALALANLVELERARGQSGAALGAIDEYVRRFPRNAMLEEVMWLRVDILHTAAAAQEYLRRFPKGTYAESARRLAGP